MEERIIKTFFDLVQIDSPSGHEEKVIQYLKKYFNTLKIKSTIDRYGNLIVHIDGFGSPLLLAGHCDTVMPGKKIKPVIKNGFIISKGNTILGADNKAGIAAILETIRYCSINTIAHRSLELVFTRSEEIGNFGAINLDYTKIHAKAGYTFDNSNPVGTIITASPFYNRFNLTIVGKDAHASRPEDGINVLSIFIDAFNKIQIGKISAKTLVNIGVVQAGHVRNAIPGKMEIQGEVRGYDEQEFEEVTEKIKMQFEKSAKKIGGSIVFEKDRENPGYEYKENNPFIKKTQKIMNSIQITPVLRKTWGVSDVNIFQQQGITMVDLADGSINPHSIDESISIEALNGLMKLILSLITSK